MATTPFFSLERRYEGISPVDSKTPISFGIGLVAGSTGIDPSVATLGVVAGQAILANSVWKKTQENYANQMTDIAAVILGVHLGSKLRKNTTAAGGSLSGLLDFCSTNVDDFKKANRVPLFKGQWNRWIVGRSAGVGDTAEDIAKEFSDPLDTMWIGSPEIRVIPIGGWEAVSPYINKIKASVKKSTMNLSPAANLYGAAQFYAVWIKAPGDVPGEMPWPLKGCPEKADWLLTSVLSPISVEKLEYEEKLAASSATPTTPTSPEKLKEAEDIAKQLIRIPTPDSILTTNKKLMPDWAMYALGAAFFGAAALLVWDGTRK